MTDLASCGSTVYEGVSSGGAIRIQGHRGRLCEDLPPSTIMVEETAGSATHMLYGEPWRGRS